jgi:predicted amidohydrolase YtcJ
VCIKADPGDERLKQIEYVQSLQKKYAKSPGLSISGIKIFADGVAEFPAQTAVLSKPYLNSGLNGDLLFDPEKLLEFFKVADQAGMSIQVHTIGDKTVTEVLDVFEKMRKENGNKKIRHTMIHLQFVNPEDYKRFKRLNIAASFSFLWAHADSVYTKLIKPYIDPVIYSWQYPINSMRKAGALIAGGSDWPVSSPNPFEAIYVGETRRNETELVLDEKEKMPRLALLYAYTINAAKVMNMENKIGSIEAGKQADLIVIDRDITNVSVEELRSAKIIWTMLDGKKIYEMQL